jgi:chromosomal replication initiation ATPase DnaA
MAGLLLKLFSDRQTPLDPDAVSYLVARMERSFAAARDLVRELDRLALAERKRVTVPVARRVLAALGRDADE